MKVQHPLAARPPVVFFAIRRLSLRCFATVFALVLTAVVAAEDDSPIELSIALVPASEDQPARFEVRGLNRAELDLLAKSDFDTARWQQLLSVYVDSNSDQLPSAMFGQYAVEGDVIVFRPRFALRPGMKYLAVLDPTKLPKAERTAVKPIRRVFVTAAAPPSPPTEVARIFPTRDVLPENQLKFYIFFSAPMSRGEAYERIHLLRASGEEVELPFLELEQELWDERGQRFTLFFDPGRIKRGLKPREEVGPSLEEGKSYELLIDAAWRDARGKPLKQAARKSFKVAAPDDTQPNPEKWKLDSPEANTREPLTVTFNESLDRAMLERVLTVVDAAGQAVNGTIEIDQHETRWRFRPEEPWPAGRYELVVETTLEDLAGNGIGRPFEVDVFQQVEGQVTRKTIGLPFETLPLTESRRRAAP